MHDAYTCMVARLLFPLHEWLKGHSTVAVRRKLEQSQWWDSARISALQLERLQRLLRHAAERVPYYRGLFARIGFEPGKVQSLAALHELPFLTKAIIRDNLGGLKAQGAVRLARYNTGGSSGEPLIFFIGRDRVSHDVAEKWRATRWWGVDIGDPEIVVWGSPIELGAQDRVRALRDALLRTRLLPAFEMSEANLDRFLVEIRARRPRMLFGYPSALSHIARHARARRVRMDDLGVKVAFVTSECLYPDQRRDIAEVFGCAVANGYGGRDAGFIAHECPQGGMHISAEDIIVEIVDAGGTPLPAGQAGEIVVTHLATQDFPFIRYRTGDIGVIDAAGCPCGRGLPLLKEIRGRTTDFVVAANGTVMHGLALVYVLRDMPGIRAFKIVQESRSRTRVLIVPEPSFTPEDEEKIRRDFRQRLGDATEVVVERLFDIPAEKSGKFRYVVSHALPAASA